MRAAGKLPKGDKWKSKYQEPAVPDTTGLSGLPEGWAWVTVDRLTSFDENAITDGPFGSNLKTSHYTASGPRVIRLQNIGDGVFIDAQTHISQEHYESLLQHRIKAGDIVVASLGDSLPRACVIPTGIGAAIVKADCIRFSPETRLALAKYLNYALNAEPTRTRTTSAVHGVGRPRLGLGGIRAITLPLPPVAEQERIVPVAERCLSLADQMEAQADASLRRAEGLRQVLLKQAFEGKLG